MLEAALWSVPALVSIGAWLRGTRGLRFTWLIVAAACGVIVLDKLVDLHAYLHDAGSQIAWTLDPDNGLRGDMLVVRLALLGGLFVAAVVGLWMFVRLDRARTAPKWTALGGLVLIFGLLGARLVPALRDLLGGASGKLPEAVAWLLVVLGCLRGLARPLVNEPD